MKFITITDALLLFILCFCICFAVFRYILGGIAVPVILSIMFSSGVCICFAVIRINKNKNAFLKMSEQKKLENMLNDFELMPDCQLLNWFCEFFTAIGFNVEKQFDHIKLNNKAVCFFDYEQQTDRKKIYSIIKNAPQNHTLFIFCRKAEHVDFENINIAKKIKIVDGYALFSLMKKYNWDYTPKYIICEKTTSIKQIITSSLTKKRAASFLFYGIILLLLCEFVYFTLYYIICSFIMFTLSFICLFFGKKEAESADNEPIDQLLNF